jgi:hypothetical protein
MKATTQLYKYEGRDNLKATLDNVAKATNSFDIDTIVIFAALTESVMRLRELVDESRNIVAVTFPADFTALVDGVPRYVGISSDEDQRRLKDAGITLVRGVMPFWGVGDSEANRMFRKALDLFGGGLQLCVQALLMACDAGAVAAGKRCIAMAADTAVVAHSENAFRFLGDQSRFAIEHVICKPVAYSISRPSVTDLSVVLETAKPLAGEPPKALPPTDEPAGA